MGALLMALYLKGMSVSESAALTLAMANSGERLDLSQQGSAAPLLSWIPGVKVDKHSTGGVGDKTTLVVAPLVAALGVPVPKMSGRALGHTGGTIDKLETIPGLTTALSPERFCRQVAEIGVAIASQTENMAPADKKIYALRDATATVESIPLIAASVMSKKLAVGAEAIVLDVKAGGGAFMRDLESARELARTMLGIGSLAGKRVVALITWMDQPLGAAVGDAAEMVEAIRTLDGQGPSDLVELCGVLAGHMLALGGEAADPEEGAARAHEALRSGAGKAKLREMVVAQGGDGGVLDDPESLLAPAVRVPVELSQVGYVAGIEARQIGLAVRHLKEAAQQGSAAPLPSWGSAKRLCGVLMEKKTGEVVGAEPVAFVIGPAEAGEAIAEAAEQVREAFAVSRQAPPSVPLLAEVVDGG